MSHLTYSVNWNELYQRVGEVCSGEADGGYKVLADLETIRDNIIQMIATVADLPAVKKDKAAIAAQRYGLLEAPEGSPPQRKL